MEIKEFDSLVSMEAQIRKDIIELFDDCDDLGIITGTMSGSLEGNINYWLNERYADSNIGLFEISSRFIVRLIFVGGWCNGGLSEAGLIAYGNIRLCIWDKEKSSYLTYHPFNTMSTDEILNYIKTGKIGKSNNLKFKYCILGDDGSIMYTLYGKDNSCVYDYFKNFGATNIKSSRVGSNMSRYEMMRDNTKHIFTVRRETITE